MPRLYRWLERPVLGVALVTMAAGYAQFSPAAALGDVAEEFGELGRSEAESLSEQAGLPGSVLGSGLAVIRLSALAALPLAGLADHHGRRRTMLTLATVGLVVTVLAAGSPGYWWFVVAFALARPCLTATDTIAEVVAAEHTSAAQRAKALALVSAAYGAGAGLVALVRAVGGDDLGFRPVFALAAVPLAAALAGGLMVSEPDRFSQRALAVPGNRWWTPWRIVGRGHGRRLAVLAAIAFASGFVTGPAGSFVFVYAENVLDVSSSGTGALVVVAGLTGLAGLVVGRALADRIGRRPTAALALALLASAGAVTYSGSVPALVVGYLAGVLCGAAYGIPAIALATELFPTSVRASTAGWLVVPGVAGATSGLVIAGALADAHGFGPAMLAVCAPAGLAAGLFALLPETGGYDLEQTAPEP